MSTVIVRQTADGHLVISPAPRFEAADVARKDVPPGIPYLIVDEALLVEGYEPDFSVPDGYGIGDEAWRAEKAAERAAQAAAEEAARLAAEEGVER